ncbi:hypothetical protein Scep_012842 [Stephania cephalantha]|uniref:Uncharacterized protein n=1 Tax=Stephania cephalantha TaxID=152367 RepID=A0AAP0P7Z4_9MAGN
MPPYVLTGPASLDFLLGVPSFLSTFVLVFPFAPSAMFLATFVGPAGALPTHEGEARPTAVSVCESRNRRRGGPKLSQGGAKQQRQRRSEAAASGEPKAAARGGTGGMKRGGGGGGGGNVGAAALSDVTAAVEKGSITTANTGAWRRPRARQRGATDDNLEQGRATRGVVGVRCGGRTESASRGRRRRSRWTTTATVATGNVQRRRGTSSGGGEERNFVCTERGRGGSGFYPFGSVTAAFVACRSRRDLFLSIVAEICHRHGGKFMAGAINDRSVTIFNLSDAADGGSRRRWKPLTAARKQLAAADQQRRWRLASDAEPRMAIPAHTAVALGATASERGDAMTSGRRRLGAVAR